MTFRTITRGTPRPILSDFRCPVHGVFEARVDSGTDEQPCPALAGLRTKDGQPLSDYEMFVATRVLKFDQCGLPSPWSPSPIVMRMRRVEAAKGRDETPIHPEWNFQRNLEEGATREEYQAERDAAAEERRKALVMDMVRSDR